MAADVHANTPLSAQEFRTHLAVQFQTLAKLMRTNAEMEGATTRRAKKLSWLQAGVHGAHLQSAGCSTWSETLLSDLPRGFLLEAPGQCVS